jgi:hypothetical protein
MFRLTRFGCHMLVVTCKMMIVMTVRVIVVCRPVDSASHDRHAVIVMMATIRREPVQAVAHERDAGVSCDQHIRQKLSGRDEHSRQVAQAGVPHPLAAVHFRVVSPTAARESRPPIMTVRCKCCSAARGRHQISRSNFAPKSASKDTNWLPIAESAAQNIDPWYQAVYTWLQARGTRHCRCISGSRLWD